MQHVVYYENTYTYTFYNIVLLIMARQFKISAKIHIVLACMPNVMIIVICTLQIRLCGA